MLTRLRRLGPDPLTILSAALVILAFTPWDFAPLLWVCLIPWFWALSRTQTTRQALLQGMWLSFFITVGGFPWVASVLQQFGGLPGWLSVVALFIYALIAQFQFLLFAPIWRWVRSWSLKRARSSVFLAFALSLAYAGLDWILPKLFVDTLGHGLYRATYLRQAADLGGASLLTFLVFWINETGFDLIRRIRTRSEPSLLPALRLAGIPFALGLALFAATFFYGKMRYAEVAEREAHPRSTIQAAVIQANIGDFDKIASERGISGAANKVINTFFELSDRALAMTPKPQMLVWPETSYPSTFHSPQTAEEAERDQKIENFVQSRGVPLLFGGYDRANGKDYNAFFFLAPRAPGEKDGLTQQSNLQVYHKNMLLMFGEYIPGAEQFQIIKSAFPQVGNFGRGEGPAVLDVRTPDGRAVQANPIICYEALFPNYAIGGARKGSQLILNITNDSWFGSYGEPQLHLSLTIFRSVETRLPQLRATNTGISTLILPNGEITQPTRIGEPEILNATIPLIEPMPTLMKAWGDWFGMTAFVLGWISLLAGAWLRRNELAQG